MLISLLVLSAHAQNNSANNQVNNANTTRADNTVTIDPNNRPTEPIKVVVSSDGGQNQGMNPQLKDWIDAFAKFLTLASLIVAVILAVVQIRRNRELRENELAERNDTLGQRQKEFRWKKAELAKTVLNEMFDNPYANDAMSMLDWGARDYDVKTSRGGSAAVEEITSRDVFAALRIAERHFNPKERYIRDCFDNFFGVMQILQHYIEIELIEPKDVRYPFAYYAEIMNIRRRAYEYFINEYHGKAGEFLARFEEWTTIDPTVNTNKAYFMFDCPPGKERFIFMLDDPQKIKKAREDILSDKEELHVTGEPLGGTVFYNEPWNFHLNPATINFVKESYELADMINKRVEQQLPRDKATFASNDVWHYGGARLLAEIPMYQFDEEEYLNDLAGRRKLERQERLRMTNNPLP
jgi:hypothetical protein